MSAIGYQHRRARKNHRCSWCDELIAVGERYARWIWKDGGDVTAVAMHFECEAAMQNHPDNQGTIEFAPGTFKRGSVEER